MGTLTEDDIKKLLEGHEDILTPMAKKEEDFLKRVPCVNCRSYSTRVEVNTLQPFSPGNPLVNKVIRCLQCGAGADPYTRIVIFPPSTSSSK